MYQPRFYRQGLRSKFSAEICYKESDLYIAADKEIRRDFIRQTLEKYYSDIENYIRQNPIFLTSLSPLKSDDRAPKIVQDMLCSSLSTGVGPFAAVAGAVAHYVGREILNYADEVLIENGGDLFLKINEDKVVGVYLGERFPVNGSSTLFLKIKKRIVPFGIASSSATIGHSLNFGRADLVTVIARNSIIADGFATALSNRIKKKDDIEKVLRLTADNPLLEGILIAFEGEIFIKGDMQLGN